MTKLRNNRKSPNSLKDKIGKFQQKYISPDLERNEKPVSYPLH